MWKRTAIFLFGLSALSASAADRKTIFVDRMDGFEAYVESAIRQSEAPVEFIEEQAHPDLKVLLGRQFTSVYAELLYQKQTGRQAGRVLRLMDIKTGKELVSHQFDLPTSDESKKRAASAFAEKLKKKLDTKS